MWKKGLVSVSFRSLEIDEIIKLTKEAGLDTIEWGSDVHAPCDGFQKLNRIEKLQDDNGVYCSSYGTYLRLGINEVEELHHYIAAARILKTNILRIWCGRKNYEEMTEEERFHLIREAKKAAEIAERENVILCVECHNNSFTNCMEGALELMRQVNSQHFRMYWQPNQHRTVEDNCRYAELIASYTVNIYVFNWEGVNRYPLEQGIDIWKKYLSYFNNDKTLLLEFMPDNDPLSLKSEASSLMKLISQD